MADGKEDALVRAVLAEAPPGAVIVGLSVSPDGRRAAALTLLRSADYLMDDLFDYVDGVWRSGEGGSGGPGINWSGGDLGVLRFAGEAPGDVRHAVVRYDGQEHRVPTEHGYFLFVVWETPFSHDPELVRFE